MILRTLAFAAGSLAAASMASAECTQVTLQEKAMEITTKAQALAAADPAKMQDVMTKLQEAGAKVATANPTDLQSVCDAYDELLASLE